MAIGCTAISSDHGSGGHLCGNPLGHFLSWHFITKCSRGDLGVELLVARLNSLRSVSRTRLYSDHGLVELRLNV